MHIYPRNTRGREVTPRLRDLTCKMESSDIAKCEGGDGVLAHPRRVEEVVGRRGLRDSSASNQWPSTDLDGPLRLSTALHTQC